MAAALELTINFEPQVGDARQRKQVKYQGLVDAGHAVGSSTELITDDSSSLSENTAEF